MNELLRNAYKGCFITTRCSWFKLPTDSPVIETLYTADFAISRERSDGTQEDVCLQGVDDFYDSFDDAASAGATRAREYIDRLLEAH